VRGRNLYGASAAEKIEGAGDERSLYCCWHPTPFQTHHFFPAIENSRDASTFLSCYFLPHFLSLWI